jgi:hypothetical protein
MDRILSAHITSAERRIAGLKRHRFAAVVAKIFREQPRLLSFVAGLSQQGVSSQSIQFLYRLLVICQHAAKEGDAAWSVVKGGRLALASDTRGIRLAVQPWNTDGREELDDGQATDSNESVLRLYARRTTEEFLRRSGVEDPVERIVSAALYIADSIGEAHEDFLFGESSVSHTVAFNKNRARYS